MKNLFLASWTMFLILLSSNIYGQCNHQDDYSALRALYLSTNGDNWETRTGWPDAATFMANPNPPPGTNMSTWYGIIDCNGGRVTSLDLSCNTLNGSLPNEIGNLVFLEALILKFDYSVYLPPCEYIIADCFVFNFLSGDIPSSIGNLTSLTQLELEGDWNSLPSTLGSLTNLQKLRVTGLQSGDLSWINSLSNLQYISMPSCNLTGSLPASIFNFSNLVHLDLSGNSGLGGSLPSSGSATGLTVLHLSNCNISGFLPSWFGDLSNLQTLGLANTLLEGCIPTSWQNLCTQNTCVDISGSQSLSTQDWSSFCSTNDGICLCTANFIPIVACSLSATNYNLTQHDNEVNGGTGLPVTWFDGDPDNGGIQISNPSNVNLNLIADLWAQVSDIGCTNSVSIPVAIAPSPIPIPSSNSPLCPGETLSLTENGGNINAWFWTGPPSFTSNIQNNFIPQVTNANAGVYSVTVTGTNGCTGTANTIVNIGGANCNNPITVALLSNPPCGGASDGTITAVPSGGTSPYSYQWSNGSTANPLSNIPAGTYTVTVTDAVGNSGTASVILTEPPTLINSLLVNDCEVVSAIEAQPGGGTPPYSYSWSTGNSSSSISNLSPGVYCLTITDSNNCTLSECTTILGQDILPPMVVFNPDFDTIMLGSSGMANLTLTELIDSLYDNCSPLDSLSISFSPDSILDSLSFNCDNEGVQAVLVYTSDEAGNIDTVLTNIMFLDNFNVCPEDTLIISASNETADLGTVFCMDFTAQNFTNIASFQYTMNFDPNIYQYESLQAFGLPGLSVSNFATNNAGMGHIQVAWSDPNATGVSFPNNTVLYQICFTALCSPGGNYALSFSGNPTSIEVVDGNIQAVLVQFMEGILQVTNDNTPPVAVCVTDLTIEVNNPLSASTLDNGSTDNCSYNLQYSYSSNTSDSILTFTCAQLGQNNVPLWVTDENGNNQTCSVNVTVNDSAGDCMTGTPCPANSPISDDCPEIIDLGIAPFCSSNCFFSNVGATESDIGLDNYPNCYVGLPERDVWFSFTAPATILDYKITITGVSDGLGSTALNMPQIALYHGVCEYNGMQLFDCASALLNENAVVLEASGLTPGLTYFLRINDWSSNAIANEGTFQICIEESDCAGSNLMGEENYLGCTGDGYQVLVNGNMYNESNPTGTEILTSFSGCDSTVNVELIFLSLSMGTEIYTGCIGDGYEVIVNGSIYNEANPSGTEVISNGNFNGCDSTVNVSLSFYPAAVSNLNQTLCTGGSVVVNGNIYDEANPSGTEVIPNGSFNGCDSTINVNLSFNSAVVNNLSPTLCPGESVTVNGNVYDQINPTGIETIIGGSYLGCDSMVNVDLAFYPPAVFDLVQGICQNESIVVNGTVYDASNPIGTEVLVGASQNGCDSMVNIDLTPLAAPSFNLNDQLCPGGSVEVNGTVYDESNPSGTEVIVDGSFQGCDSVVNVALTFYSPAVSNFSPTLCSDEFVMINGNMYELNTPSGTETLTGASYHGCDSTVHVNLDFYPINTFDLTGTFCNDTSFLVNNVIYDESNPIGAEVLENASWAGCDSIVQVDLVFKSEVTGNLDTALCKGKFITVNGTVYDEPNPTGEEIFPMGSFAGCDSVVYVNLSFLEAAETFFEQAFCINESININGTIYDVDNPTGTEVLTGANGCDSTVFVDLSFNDPIVVELERTLCPGDFIIVNGNVYDESNPEGTEYYGNCDTVAHVKLNFDTEAIKMPNVFTPNGDGKNDAFDPYAVLALADCSNYEPANAELTILNRWGDVVYRAAKPYAPWYGYNGPDMTGTKLPQGTYYYMLKGKEGEKDFEVKGAVNLLDE